MMLQTIINEWILLLLKSSIDLGLQHMRVLLLLLMLLLHVGHVDLTVCLRWIRLHGRGRSLLLLLRWWVLTVEDWQVGVRFHEQGACGVVDGLARLLALDDAQPFALELRHGRRAEDDVEAVVDEPDEVVEVACAVLWVREPVADFLLPALHQY